MIMNTMQDEYTKGKINSFKNQLESIEENIAAIKNEVGLSKFIQIQTINNRSYYVKDTQFTLSRDQINRRN